MEDKEVLTLPMIPLRDVVLFPGMIMPFLVGRESSLRALESVLANDRRLFFASQHSAETMNPRIDQICSIGTIGTVVENLRCSDGTFKVLIDGQERARILESRRLEYFDVTVKVLHRSTGSGADLTKKVQELGVLLKEYARVYPNLFVEQTLPGKVDDPGKLADTVISFLTLDRQQKQDLLETIHPGERLARVIELITIEIDRTKVEKKIGIRVRKQMQKAQREYYLNEKIKAIQQELGQQDEDIFQKELDQYKKRIDSEKLSKDARGKAIQELRKLQMMPPMSAEGTITRNYLDWILSIPWSEKSREQEDLKRAQKVLEEDHYGLEKIKERILEFLAIRKLSAKKGSGTILCFVGPPGVGKTSLASSIARASGRKFVRLSLGGVRDEAEIRGHRRTYIGAYPGQILQMMKRAGTINPVFLLDEIDKMSTDFRGDPSAALLEVLDPEQNKAFLDHYLDTSYDLSKVLFVATANVPDHIPPALYDRMEILQLPGYTGVEKIQIASRFLIRKQLEAHGLTQYRIQFKENGIRNILEHYTREAGVRNLEREIASICRKITKKIALGETYPESVDVSEVNELLGIQKFRDQDLEMKDEIGLATGLAWTETGGELLFAEATLMNGKGRLMLTGKLGKVMQESARAALSYIRSRTGDLGVSSDFYRNYDFHVHIPEGAIPKDGPSAGITMATALVSALTKNPVKSSVAMTGEITLRGKILPIGGVKEKVLAAHRAGLATIILPRKNEKDLSEIPADIRKNLQVELVDTMDEVLRIALNSPSRTKIRRKPKKLLTQ